MLSPDNFVQAPNNSQSFNRYSYALNNPLIYTDPDGEFLGLAFMVMAFSAEWVSNIMNNVDDPAGTAYSNVTNTMNGMNSSMQYTVYDGHGATVTAGIDPFNLGVSVNYYYSNVDGISVQATAGAGFIQSGFISGSVGYEINDFDFSIGASYGSSTLNMNGTRSLGGGAVFGGIKYSGDDWSIGYSYSQFTGSHNQGVGSLSGSYKDWSLRIDNDIFAWGGEDRWRTSAIEIGFKEFALGTNILTNDPKGEGSTIDLNGRNLRGKKNKHGNGAWDNGQVYHAPLYISHRSGNRVSRIGFSNPMVQDRTQNFIHKNFGFGNFGFGYQNFYNKYDNFTGGIYSYSGIYNPYTLY
jgi:hypothetical protein